MSDDNPYASPIAGEPRRPNTSHARYVVLAWLGAVSAIAYMQRSMHAVEQSIRSDLGMSESWMGWVMGAFFVTYAIFQIPAGWLADRWGSRKTLVLSTAVCSLAAALVALARGVPMLTIGRLGMGVGQAGLFPAATMAIARWLPRRDRGLASGVLAAFMSAGAAGAAPLTGWLLQRCGWPWQWTVLLFAAPGILWAWWFGRWFRDTPADHPAVSDDELRTIGTAASPAPAAGPREPMPWRALVSSGSMWLINTQQFCRAAGYVFFITWFTTYLTKTRGVSLESAGALTSLPLLAVVAGSPLGGAVSDWLLHRTGNRWIGRNLVAAVSMLVCAALITVSYWIDDALAATLLITAGSFCAAFGGPVAYAITIDMGGKHTATVFSTMNMSGNVGAAVFPYVAGWIVAATGEWDIVLFTFAGVYVVAAVCWLPVRARGTIFDMGDSELTE